jgi:predicted metal-dependent enzyme (double-stranded beta helix superfamily)
MSDADPEFIHDHPRVREFVETVHETAEAHEAVPALLDAISPAFESLLANDDWLPEQYRRLPDEHYDDKGEMGDDIAQWLLYREGSKLALFTLVLPEGASTPVHDHLAWGMVGLHGGRQRETFYRRVDDGKSDRADLEQIRSEKMSRGDYYRLVPPENDIHSVETVSTEPSVSVHLLGADVGCIERHAYDPGEGAVDPFVSGYTNVECEVDVTGHDHENVGVHTGGDHALGEDGA